jgi:hypothetical protein
MWYPWFAYWWCECSEQDSVLFHEMILLYEPMRCCDLLVENLRKRSCSWFVLAVQLVASYVLI